MWCTKDLIVSLSEVTCSSSHLGVSPVIFLCNLAQPWLHLGTVSSLSCRSVDPHARKQDTRAPDGSCQLFSVLPSGFSLGQAPLIYLGSSCLSGLPSQSSFHSSALEGFAFWRLSRHSCGCDLQMSGRAFVICPASFLLKSLSPVSLT